MCLSIRIARNTAVLLLYGTHDGVLTDKTNLHLQTIDDVFTNDPAEAERRLIHSVNEMDLGLNTMG